jgi:hypothetical protein
MKKIWKSLHKSKLDYHHKKKPEIYAAAATIRANTIAWLALLVSIMSIGVTLYLGTRIETVKIEIENTNISIRQGLDETKTVFQEGMEKTAEAISERPVFNSSKEVGIISGIRLYGESGAFRKNVEAMPGGLLEVSMSIYNTGGVPLELVIIASLPMGIEYVNGSSQIFSAQCNGEYFGDVTDWISLGRFREYDSVNAVGYATIRYQVRVTDDFNTLTPGLYTLHITNSVYGRDFAGSIATDTNRYAVSVTVDFTP